MNESKSTKRTYEGSIRLCIDLSEVAALSRGTALSICGTDCIGDDWHHNLDLNKEGSTVIHVDIPLSPHGQPVVNLEWADQVDQHLTQMDREELTMEAVVGTLECLIKIAPPHKL